MLFTFFMKSNVMCKTKRKLKQITPISPFLKNFHSAEHIDLTRHLTTLFKKYSFAVIQFGFFESLQSKFFYLAQDKPTMTY